MVSRFSGSTQNPVYQRPQPLQTVAVVTYLAEKKLRVIRTVHGLHVRDCLQRVKLKGEIGAGVVVVIRKTSSPERVSM